MAAGLLAAALAGALLVVAAPAGAAPEDGLSRVAGPVRFDHGRYVVVLRQPGAARYDGGGAFARTSPSGEAQFNARTPAARAYTRHLLSSHRQVAGEVGASIRRDYTTALNGFAAELTAEQAMALTRDRRVLLVTPDKHVRPQTWHTPEVLGMTGRKGAWNRHGGRSRAGAGTVIGVLDTGIWPESKSFDGRRLTGAPTGRWDLHRRAGRTFMDKADGTRFQGVCQTGEEFTSSQCNTKVIGARYYPDYYLGLSEDQRTRASEYLSPRDGDGHGTHTASTAAGNAGVRARIPGRTFGRVSGMAPGARIAVYKVLWQAVDPDRSGGSTSGVVAAIDDAVADGVDVINYSVGGGAEADILDPVMLAFRGAAEAGIFVAGSAGNHGSAAGTVEKPAPWVTSVAASTHVRFENTVELGNGRRIAGASITDDPVPSRPLVDSAEVAVAGASAANARVCAPGALDPAQVEGKIVVCTRGVTERLTKSAEVARADGVGMVLRNPAPGSVNAEPHAVPTVHVDEEGAATVEEYLDRTGGAATARIRLGNRTSLLTPVPQIAGFSSRGPSIANDADILKPDLTAPGVNVLAAVAPPSNSGHRFALYSGTSMAAPHIAGLAAFMSARRPEWTPMEIKSAMMTTARSLLDESGGPAHDPFAQGAGQVRPRRMFDPGLLVASDARQWQGLLTAAGLDTGPGPLAAKDVNQPSMAQGQILSTASFERRLLATRAGTWQVTADVPGFSAITSTDTIVADRKNDIVDLEVRFTRTTAPLAEFTTGFVTLSGPTRVRIPVALRPVSVSPPATASGTGTDGSVAIPVTPGFTGALDVTETGLAAAKSAVGTVDVGGAVGFCLQVGAGSKVLRADLDATEGDADLDMYVVKMDASCRVAEELVGVSASEAADESVTIPNPEPGRYLVEVDGFAGAGPEPTVDFRLDAYDVSATTDLGGFHADPDQVPVTAGAQTSFDAVWSALASGERYLGVLEYAGALSPTYVQVDTGP